MIFKKLFLFAFIFPTVLFSIELSEYCCDVLNGTTPETSGGEAYCLSECGNGKGVLGVLEGSRGCTACGRRTCVFLPESTRCSELNFTTGCFELDECCDLNVTELYCGELGCGLHSFHSACNASRYFTNYNCGDCPTNLSSTVPSSISSSTVSSTSSSTVSSINSSIRSSTSGEHTSSSSSSESTTSVVLSDSASSIATSDETETGESTVSSTTEEKETSEKIHSVDIGTVSATGIVVKPNLVIENRTFNIPETIVVSSLLVDSNSEIVFFLSETFPTINSTGCVNISGVVVVEVDDSVQDGDEVDLVYSQAGCINVDDAILDIQTHDLGSCNIYAGSAKNGGSVWSVLFSIQQVDCKEAEEEISSAASIVMIIVVVVVLFAFVATGCIIQAKIGPDKTDQPVSRLLKGLFSWD